MAIKETNNLDDLLATSDSEYFLIVLTAKASILFYTRQGFQSVLHGTGIDSPLIRKHELEDKYYKAHESAKGVHSDSELSIVELPRFKG